MIGPCCSYLQGGRFRNILLLLSEVQSCQVGSSGSISGLSKTQLPIPHPSPLHTWAKLDSVCSGWGGNWEKLTSVKALVLGGRAGKTVWRGQMTASGVIAMMGRETLCPPVAELAGSPAFCKCFWTFQDHRKFGLLSQNIEMQRKRTAK